VPTRQRDALDQPVADFLRELGQLIPAQALEVGGAMDGGEKGHWREGAWVVSREWWVMSGWVRPTTHDCLSAIYPASAPSAVEGSPA